jgi:hypothetical protein
VLIAVSHALAKRVDAGILIGKQGHIDLHHAVSSAGENSETSTTAAFDLSQYKAVR